MKLTRKVRDLEPGEIMETRSLCVDPDVMAAFLATIIPPDGCIMMHLNVYLEANVVVRPLETARDVPDNALCPCCGGPADRGFSRDVPPVPYMCSKCDQKYQ